MSEPNANSPPIVLLTDTNGDKVLVNLSHVTNIRSRKGGGRVTFVTGNGIDVQERPTEIVRLCIEQSVEMIAELMPLLEEML